MSPTHRMTKTSQDTKRPPFELNINDLKFPDLSSGNKRQKGSPKYTQGDLNKLKVMMFKNSSNKGDKLNRSNQIFSRQDRNQFNLDDDIDRHNANKTKEITSNTPRIKHHHKKRELTPQRNRTCSDFGIGTNSNKLSAE